MSMIRTIQIRGFKSIASQELELGRVNCFVGANGVGKSNVLEAIGILSAAATGRVDDEAITRRGVRVGLPRLYKTSFESVDTPPHILLSATNQGGAAFQVSLLNPLEKPEPAWKFNTESLTEHGTTLVSRGPRSKNLVPTSGLSALKMVELQPISSGVGLLLALQNYAIHCPNTPALRATQPDPQMRIPVGLSGGGLAEAFDAMQKTVSEDELESVLELVDWASDIRTSESAATILAPSVPRSKSVLRFTDRFMAASRNTLTAYDASEGALYVLFAAVLCLAPKAPELIAIDNLDQALNPRLITRLTGRLSGWLKATDPNRQLLFTAHNPAVLDGLDLTDDEVRLFAVERNSEGHTSVRRITLSDELREKNSEYPLSRLWMMGHLGAVPNV